MNSQPFDQYRMLKTGQKAPYHESPTLRQYLLYSMYKQLRYVMGLIFISKYVSNIPHPDFVELLLVVQDKNNILDPQSNYV